MDRRNPRVHFLVNKHDTYTGLLNMPSPKTECQVLELRVEEYVRDKMEPVVFSLNVSLDEQKVRKALQNLDSYPVLSHTQKMSERKVINFQKECGSDNKCTSNLQLTAKFANERLKPYPSQGNHPLLQYGNNVKKMMLLVEVTNLPGPGKVAEDAHQAMLNISIPSTLRYSSMRSQDPDVECSAEKTVICELGNPPRSNEMVSLQLIFETSGINLNTCCLRKQQEIVVVTLHPHIIISYLQQSSEQNDLCTVVLLIENFIQTSFSM
ncbi:integrin alpha-3-like [Salvelinus alpinus]